MHSHAMSGRWGGHHRSSPELDPRALWLAMTGGHGRHKGRGRGPVSYTHLTLPTTPYV